MRPTMAENDQQHVITMTEIDQGGHRTVIGVNGTPSQALTDAQHVLQGGAPQGGDFQAEAVENNISRRLEHNANRPNFAELTEAYQGPGINGTEVVHTFAN